MNKERVKSISKAIGKFVLATAIVGGAVTLFSVMPGLPMAFAPFVGKKRYYENESYYKKYAKQVIKRLEKQGMVKILEKKGETMLVITKLGKEQLEKWQKGKLKIKKPPRWDGKWRIVIFDIPEKTRYSRDVVREELKSLEFFYLQNSVWVYPYECEEIVQVLAKTYNLLPYMIYLEADYLGNDKYLRQIFKV